VDVATAAVGWSLIAGLVVFAVGAGAWRLSYERPLPEALRIIHGDRRRRAWIHLWMIPALLITSAGTAGLATWLDAPSAVTLAVMAATVYALGAVCWIVSLAFRLTVVPWAAERTVADDQVPEVFGALDAWAGSLYVIHMAAAYAAFALLGTATLASDQLPTWLGWLGIGWGLSFLAGFALTRAAGPFNPPFWAHMYTTVIGVTLLLA
jgi:hypothetical protein